MLQGHERYPFCLPAAWLQRSLLSAGEGRALYIFPRPVLGQASVLCDSIHAQGASVSLLTFHPELRPLQSFPVLLAQSVHAKLCPLCTHGRRACCREQAGDYPRVRTMGTGPPALFSLSLPSERTGFPGL